MAWVLWLTGRIDPQWVDLFYLHLSGANGQAILSSMEEKAILATLAYYDVLDLPLTKLELWHYLINPGRWNPPTEEFQLLRDGAIIEILAELGKMVEEGKVEQTDAFYHLPGRQALAHERLLRQKIAETKWKTAKRYLWLAQGLPYIRALLASGSLGLGFMEAESDLDILTITAPGRIWLARLFLTGLMGLLGRRRKRGQTSAPDKLCLNHYITEGSLAIPWQSLYNAQTYAHLWPVYLRRRAVIDDFNLANQWLGEYLWQCSRGALLGQGTPTGAAGVEISRQRLVKPSWFLQALGACAERLLELTRLGPALNRLAKKLQLRRLAKDQSDRGRGRITTTDEQLEFHPHSPETAMLDKYNQTIKQLGQFGDYWEKDSGLA